MKRRRFIHSAASVLALGVTPVAAAPPQTLALSALAQPGLLSFLGDSDYICQLGQAYRERYPAEDHAELLVRAILHGLDLQATGLQASRIADEFVKGDTVLLNGWILSRTEARQSALYSILNN